jgi:hypothetical protein
VVTAVGGNAAGAAVTVAAGFLDVAKAGAEADKAARSHADALKIVTGNAVETTAAMDRLRDSFPVRFLIDHADTIDAVSATLIDNIFTVISAFAAYKGAVLTKKSADDGVIATMTQQYALQKQVAVGMSGVTRAALLGSTAMKGLQLAGRGLLGVFGGPLGLAFTVLTPLVVELSTAETDAEKIMRQWGGTLDEFGKGGAAAAAVIKQMQQAASGLNQTAAENALSKVQEDIYAIQRDLVKVFSEGAGIMDIWRKEAGEALEGPLASLKNLDMASAEFRDELQRLGKEHGISPETIDGFIKLSTQLQLSKEQQKIYLQHLEKIRSGNVEASGSFSLMASQSQKMVDAFEAAQKPFSSAEDAAKYLADLDQQAQNAGKSSKDLAQAKATEALAMMEATVATDDKTEATLRLGAEAARVAGNNALAESMLAEAAAMGAATEAARAKVVGYKKALASGDLLKGFNTNGASSIDKAAQSIQSLSDSIKATQYELDNWHLPPLEREQKKINDEYTKTVDNAQKITNATQRELTLKDALLKKEKAERELTERTAAEKEQHLRDQADFYGRLAELSGQYGLDVEWQNQLIDLQAQKWLAMDIPADDVQRMTDLLKQQAAVDPASGIARAFQKYQTEAGNLAKGYESAFGNLLSGLDSAGLSLWKNFGSGADDAFSGVKASFKNLLAELMHIAITRPILVKLSGEISGALGLTEQNGAQAGQTGQGGLGDLIKNLSLRDIYNGVSGLFSSGGGSGAAVSAARETPQYVLNTLPNSMAMTGEVGASAGLSGAALTAARETPSFVLNTLPNSMAMTGEAGAAATSGASSVLGTLGTAAGYYGMGSLGYSTLGKAVGLPQGEWSGIGAGLVGMAGGFAGSAIASSAALAGSAMAAGAAMGSVIPVVGTAIGAIIGGLAGALMSDTSKPKRPAALTDVSLNLGNASAYDDYDFYTTFGREIKDHAYAVADSGAYSLDPVSPSHSGLKTETGHYAIAVRARNMQGFKKEGEAAEPILEVAKQMADEAVSQMQELQAALPKEYGDQLQAQLAARPVTGWKYDFKFKSEEDWNKGIEKMQAEFQKEVAKTLLESFQAMDFSGYAGKINVDTRSLDGLTLFAQAVAAVDEAVNAAKELREPTSEWVTQAKAAQAQMDAWAETMQTTGVTAEYAAELVDDYRAATVESFVGSIKEFVTPLSDLEKSVKSNVAQVEGWIEALKILNATEEQIAVAESARAAIQLELIDTAEGYVYAVSEMQSTTDGVNATFDSLAAAMRLAGNSLGELARLEDLRTAALQKAQNALREPFYQDMRVRAATVAGQDTAGMQLDYSHKTERAEKAKTFGEDSHEYAMLLAVQEVERLGLAAKQAEQDLEDANNKLKEATAEYESAASAYESAAAELQSATEAVEQARLALVQALIDAEAEARQGVKTAIDALVKGAQSAFDSALSAYTSAINNEIAQHKNLAASLNDVRRSLWRSDTLGPQTNYSAAGHELNDLYKRAMQGDADAAQSFGDAAKNYLDASYGVQGDYSAYLADFDKVQSMLRAVEDKNLSAAKIAEQQLKTLQEQLGVVTDNEKNTAQLYADLLGADGVLQLSKNLQQQTYDKLNLGVAAELSAVKGQLTPENLGITAVKDKLTAENLGIDGLGDTLATLSGSLDESYATAYGNAVIEWKQANTDLTTAVKDGITTDAEVASGKIVTAIDNLRKAWLDAINNQADKQTTANEKERTKSEKDTEKQQAETNAGNKKETYNAQLETAQKAGSDVATELAKPLPAPTTAPALLGKGYAGSLYASENALATAKVDALNRSRDTGGGYVAAGGWTSQNFRTYLNTRMNGMSVGEWYSRYGVLEGFSAGGFAGSKYATQSDLLQAKANDMNAGKNLAPGQRAGGWTPVNVLASIQGAGYVDVADWYARQGILEGYAKGGIASGWAVVGEEGPEIVNFTNPGRVYTAEETREMLGRTVYVDRQGDSGKEAAALLKQVVRLLTQQNHRLADLVTNAAASRKGIERTARAAEQANDEAQRANYGAGNASIPVFAE